RPTVDDDMLDRDILAPDTLERLTDGGGAVEAGRDDAEGHGHWVRSRAPRRARTGPHHVDGGQRQSDVLARVQLGVTVDVDTQVARDTWPNADCDCRRQGTSRPNSGANDPHAARNGESRGARCLRSRDHIELYLRDHGAAIRSKHANVDGLSRRGPAVTIGARRRPDGADRRRRMDEAHRTAVGECAPPDLDVSVLTWHDE